MPCLVFHFRLADPSLLQTVGFQHDDKRAPARTAANLPMVR
jgi:hypothetical protein